MKKIITSFICMVITINTLYAQNKYFEQFYNYQDATEIRQVVPTPDNGYLLAGEYLTFVTGKWQTFLLKINSEGDTLFYKTYPVIGEQGILDMVVTENGFVATGPVSPDFILDYSDAYIAFFDFEGNKTSETVFSSTFGGSTGFSIEASLDGGYLVGGAAVDYDYEWRVTKLDSLGVVQWDSIYVLPVHSNQIHDVIVAPDGSGYYLCGFVDWDWFGFPYRQADMALMKIDLNGVPQWYKQYDPAEDDKAFCSIQTHDGGFILGGVIAPEQVGRAALFKVNSLGNEENGWWEIYLTEQKSEVAKITELPNHTLVCAGNTSDVLNLPPNPWDFEGYLQKVDSVGGLLWRRIYGNERDDYIYDMIPLAQNEGYIMVGRSEYVQNDTAKTYGWVVKTNCMGLLTEPQANFTAQIDTAALTASFYNLSQFVYPDSIDGGHYIWDFGDGNTSAQINPTHTYAHGGNYTVTLTAVVCNDTSVFVQEVSTWAVGIAASPLPPPKEGQQEGEIRVLPNPANEQISISPPSGGWGVQTHTFVLYDVLGREVLRQHLSSNNTIVTEHLPAGVYLYQIINSQKQTLQHGKISIMH